jgi:hypothetical protein
MFPAEMRVAIRAMHMVAAFGFVNACAAFRARFRRLVQLLDGLEKTSVAIMRYVFCDHGMALDADEGFAYCAGTLISCGYTAATVVDRACTDGGAESVFADGFRREFGDRVGFFVSICDFESVSEIFLDFATFLGPCDEVSDRFQLGLLLQHELFHDGLFGCLRNEFGAELFHRVFR